VTNISMYLPLIILNVIFPSIVPNICLFAVYTFFLDNQCQFLQKYYVDLITDSMSVTEQYNQWHGVISRVS
jgi:hypothetical protein